MICLRYLSKDKGNSFGIFKGFCRVKRILERLGIKTSS